MRCVAVLRLAEPMSRTVSSSDFTALAGQLERTARVLRARGDESLRRARDWATPLRSSGTDPGRGKGNISDPTGTAALSFDPNAEELTLLSVDAGHCFDAAVSLESRVLRIATDAVIENQRAGIGECSECGDYQDGTRERRLRSGICDRCRKRLERKEAKNTPCEHRRSSTWSHGTRSCTDCGAVLDVAAAQ